MIERKSDPKQILSSIQKEGHHFVFGISTKRRNGTHISCIVYVHTLVHVLESSSVFNMGSFIPILTLEKRVNDAKGAVNLIDLLQIQKTLS